MLHNPKRVIAHPILTIKIISLQRKVERQPSIRLIDELWVLDVRRQCTHSPIVKLLRKIVKAINNTPIDEGALRSEYLFK